MRTKGSNRIGKNEAINWQLRLLWYLEDLGCSQSTSRVILQGFISSQQRYMTKRYERQNMAEIVKGTKLEYLWRRIENRQ